MKKLIVLLGTILLGIIIVSTFMIGNGDTSFKKGAENVTTKVNSSITTFTTGH